MFNIMIFLGIKDKLKYLYTFEFVLILLGFILRLKLYLYNNSFFIDECALGANIINRNYLELFLPLQLFQCSPPFFLMASKFILDISHQLGNLYTQDLVLRFLPLFCSIASLPLFAIFLNKITNNKIFIWICLAMMSFNDIAISYAAIFKQYSTELMFSLILLLIFHNFSINLSKKNLILYSFIICISIWFSNTAIFLIVAELLYFICKYLNKSFREEIKPNLAKFIKIIFIPFSINFLLYYFCYFTPVYKSQYLFMKNFWTTFISSFLTLNNFPILFYQRLQGIIETPFTRLFLYLFLLLNVILLLKNKEFKNKTKFFIIIPIIFSIIASFINKYPFFAKFILYLLPMFIILYCQVIFFIKYLDKKFIKTFKIFTIIVLFLCFCIKMNQPLAKELFINDPARNAFEFIKQNNIPINKIIIVPFGHADYYATDVFKDKKPLLYDSPWDGFKNSAARKFIDTCPKGDYWYINMFLSIRFTNETYNKQYLNYLKNNKHVKILKTYHYDHPDNVYIIHFEKK